MSPFPAFLTFFLGNLWVGPYRPSGPGMRVAQPPSGPVKVFYEDSASDQESPLLQRGMCRPGGKNTFYIRLSSLALCGALHATMRRQHASSA